MATTGTKTPLSYETEIYINIGTESTPQYEEINKGFTGFSKTNNPTTQTQQYIGDINATTQITALGMQFSYTGERVVGDAANDYFASLDGKIGNDLKTTLVKVNTWDEGNNATMYNVVVAVSSDGDLAGGSTQAISGTVYVNGDPVKGTFDKTSKKFTATT